MSNSINTQFSDSANSGIIKLYKNPFNNGAEYYAKLERQTIDSKTLIARIQKHKAGTNELALQQNVGFLKEEILEALRSGEAVNVLDLGTLYIAPDAKYENGCLDANGKQLFNVKFTSSTLLKDAVSSLGVKQIQHVSALPIITYVIDKYTENTEGVLTATKEVRLVGERLKLADGQGNNIYLCPLDSNKNIIQDESLWLATPKVTKNTQKYLEFYLPEEATTNTEYCILVRTTFSNTKNVLKVPKEVISNVVTVR